MQTIDVAIPIPIDKLFSYAVPQDLQDKIKIGMRVKVPFGMRMAVGYVIKTVHSPQSTVDGKILKEIIETIDEEPVVNEEIMELCRWVSEYYLCPLGKVLHAAVPVKNSVQYQVSSVQQELNTKNCGLWTVYRGQQELKIRKQKMTGFFIPTEEQKQALDAIEGFINAGKHEVVLLQGEPKSGKTEVYLQLIASVMDNGKKALVIIPEIPLMENWLDRFRERFGDEKISFLHSNLTQKQYDIEWQRIKRGEASVVIGSRSAVFSPIKDLGLIVIDGEEDEGLKEEKEPRYHARDAAIFRAKYNNAILVMESSAPSMESYYLAIKGRYKLFNLKTVPGLQEKAKIEILDLKKKEIAGSGLKSKIFSQFLLKSIDASLSKKEKTLLFLNRRGFAGFILCKECGKGIHCPNCDVPLSFHKPDILICHYCKYRIEAPDNCPSCNGVELRYFGKGTEQACEELKKLFPLARVGRLDTDIAKEKGSAKGIIEDFKNNKIDILVGTQMVIKKNLTEVNLSGVILADTMLNVPDFRSAERTFQILTGLMGTLNARSDSGMIVQTYNPEHYAFTSLKENGYADFFGHELKMRRSMGYPPFKKLINIVISGDTQAKVFACANAVSDGLKQEISLLAAKIKKLKNTEILGPSLMNTRPGSGKYRYQIIIKADPKILGNITEALRKYKEDKKLERITVDVDPYRMS